MKNKIKICFCITSRADFSLAYPVIKEFQSKKKFEIIVITSGYLSGKKFGKKINLIRDKINVDYEIKNYPVKDSSYEITNALSNGIKKFAKIFQKIKPDYLFVFADKFEMFAPTISAIQYNIKICHIEGGDITEGAIDDNIRHSITKLSHLHFVSTQRYKQRLIQLGEEKWRICVTGSPSLDLIKEKIFLNKAELTKKFNFNFKKEFILCTFHPVTNEIQNSQKYILSLINSLKKQKQINLIFTSSNADLTNTKIKKEIINFSKKYSNVKFMNKLDYIDYLSLMKNCKFMIGNSSSGIIESASVKTKVVNIGNRQKGRVIPKNVISCGYKEKEILTAISDISNMKNKFLNPYYQKNVSKKIYKFFHSNLKKNIINKKFIDLKQYELFN